MFREAVLHRHPKERERTVDAPANRQDGNSAAKALNRCESQEKSAGGFPFFGSLKTVLSFRKRKERTGFRNRSPRRRGTTATPFLLSLAKEETVLRAKEERRFWARFSQARFVFTLWKRCFCDLTDFATIAASGGTTVLRDRLPASLCLNNAAGWFCLQGVSVQRSNPA